MDIVKTLDDAVPFLSAYPTWVKVLVGVSILLIAISVIALLFSPKTVPVERWLLASDDATIKALVPAEMLQDLETKKQTAKDLQKEFNQIRNQFLGQNPPTLLSKPKTAS
jgi:hypothetical protein